MSGNDHKLYEIMGMGCETDAYWNVANKDERMASELWAMGPL